MAKSRLGLVAVAGSYEGPWIMANGYKRADAVVHGLDSLAQLLVCAETPDGLYEQLLSEGNNELSISDWYRYHVVKCVNDADVERDTPTTVDFVFS